MTKCDCLRLKLKFGYFLALYRRGEDFDVFQGHAKAVLEHHFNNHEQCGDWCPHKQQGGAAGPAKLKYRCKERDDDLYKMLLDVHNRYHEGYAQTSLSRVLFAGQRSSQSVHLQVRSKDRELVRLRMI
jgi:hypothetical protein